MFANATQGDSMSRSPYGERGLKYKDVVQGKFNTGRSPYGERGLKYRHRQRLDTGERRSPYGERGLKLDFLGPCGASGGSLSLRRAWIEISAPPALPDWILRSLSLRRAWIEIRPWPTPSRPRWVALLTESVD